jgi:hypothetical protein
MAETAQLKSWTILAAAVFAVAALHMSVANAKSGDRIGDAVAIVNTVKADDRKLAVGDDVRQDETIEVSVDSQGELKLEDNTKLALAAGARLVLDKFVYDSDKKSGSVVVNLAKGAFRFITGVASKPTYIIHTPNASITVRGTIFDLFILPDQNVWLLLHEGGVEVTGAKNVCHVLDQPGQLMRISSTGRVSPPVNWSKLTGNADVPFDTAFPFVKKAPQIDPTPLLTRAQIIDAAFPDVPEKPCLNPVPGTPIKIRKADDGDDGDKPKPKKRKVVKQDDNDDAPNAKPTKTAKRPPSDDDDCANCVTGMDIVIGGGIGFGGGRHRPSRERGN